MAQKPLILITNDDGINAPGLRKLISLVEDLGDIIVIASEHPMSGMGHDLWPRAAAVDHLAKEKATAIDRGLVKPFIFTGLKNY